MLSPELLDQTKGALLRAQTATVPVRAVAATAVARAVPLASLEPAATDGRGLVGWMVVRFVCVIRVPVCARVSRVCPGPPRCLFTGNGGGSRKTPLKMASYEFAAARAGEGGDVGAATAEANGSEPCRAPKRRWQCRINRKPIVYFHVNFINIPTIDTIAQVWSCGFTLRGWTSGLKGARTCVHRVLEHVHAATALSGFWHPMPQSSQTHPDVHAMAGMSNEDCPQNDLSDKRWQDESLTRKTELEDWEPRLQISNLITTDKWTMKRKWMTSADEEMEFKWTITGTFLEQLEIHSFPRDMQVLQIKITSSIPQFIINQKLAGAELSGKVEDAERLPALLDELADLQQRELAIDSDHLSAPEVSRKEALLAWRKHDARVQRVLRLAPHYEVRQRTPRMATR